jgi:hypothetical protein
MLKTPAANERFCVIAAVTPQIKQCKLASYCPAASSVEAATTPSRHTLAATRETTSQKRTEIQREKADRENREKAT